MKYSFIKTHANTKTFHKTAVRLIIAGMLAILLVALTAISHLPLKHVTAAGYQAGTPTITIAAPAANAYEPGAFDLVAQVSGAWVGDYDMYWYVDNGAWNPMGSDWNLNHKYAQIDVSGWHWHAPSDVYTITLVAVLHANGQRVYGGVPIHVGNAPVSPTPSTTTLSGTTTTPAPTIQTPLSLYVNPNSNAASEAASTSDPTMKRVMTRLAGTPTASWFGDWNNSVQSDVNSLVTAAANAGKTPVLVAYDIPMRDCGSYSGGGATSPDAYKAWIQGFANGIGSRSALVILEPDAVAQATCLSSTNQAIRYQLLNFAITTLKSHAGTKVYLDGGNPSWVGASDLANRLKQAGIANADGFSLNVSNFIATSDNLTYGHQVAALLGNKHFVVDTSRNGNGTNGQWCNPSGRALGTTPTANTGDSLADYFLWIKTPGESDGTCNGGPAAGAWWPSYAENLALSAGW